MACFELLVMDPADPSETIFENFNKTESTVSVDLFKQCVIEYISPDINEEHPKFDDHFNTYEITFNRTSQIITMIDSGLVYLFRIV